MASHKQLTKALERVKNLKQAAQLFERVKTEQVKKPDDHGLWDLRIRALRKIGENLPPKHTGQGGAGGAKLPVDRRLAYSARLTFKVPLSRFEEILAGWEMSGDRPKVQLLLKLARKDRGEDPKIAYGKAVDALCNLRDAVADTDANMKALKTAASALGRVSLNGSKFQDGRETARQAREIKKRTEAMKATKKTKKKRAKKKA